MRTPPAGLRAAGTTAAAFGIHTFRSALSLARRHPVFLGLLTVGAVLRLITLYAYRPALLGMPDSAQYLRMAADLEPSVRPIGYSLFLRLLPFEVSLAVVPLAQHLLGLACAALLYALLVRLGVGSWLAALATAPVLLDGYQLNIEQYILTDSLFQVLLVAACALLLWRQPPSLLAVSLAGLAFAGAALTRPNGLLAFVPACLALIFLRVPPWRVAAFLAASLLPVGAYLLWYHSVHGEYRFSGREGRLLYARVASFADCTEFPVPEHERVLCLKRAESSPLRPGEPKGSGSPFPFVRPPPGKTQDDVAGDFARRVIRNQPLAYANAIASDFVRSFAPTRSRRGDEPPVGQWRFASTYPIFHRGDVCAPSECRGQRRFVNRTLRAHGHSEGKVAPRFASFLHSYQRFFYTPGPLLAAGLLLGVAAALGLGRARRPSLRAAAFLFSATTCVVLLSSLASFGFSWRYQLPQLVLIPPAAAVGLTALMKKRNAQAAETQ